MSGAQQRSSIAKARESGDQDGAEAEVPRSLSFLRPLPSGRIRKVPLPLTAIHWPLGAHDGSATVPSRKLRVVLRRTSTIENPLRQHG